MTVHDSFPHLRLHVTLGLLVTGLNLEYVQMYLVFDGEPCLGSLAFQSPLVALRW